MVLCDNNLLRISLDIRRQKSHDAQGQMLVVDREAKVQSLRSSQYTPEADMSWLDVDLGFSWVFLSFFMYLLLESSHMGLYFFLKNIFFSKSSGTTPGTCSGLNGDPPTGMSRSTHPASVRVTLFEKGVFMDVIKLR
jgi:hypothetical protein